MCALYSAPPGAFHPAILTECVRHERETSFPAEIHTHHWHDYCERQCADNKMSCEKPLVRRGMSTRFNERCSTSTFRSNMRCRTLYLPCHLAERDGDRRNVCLVTFSVSSGTKAFRSGRKERWSCLVRISLGVFPVQRLHARVKALISR